MPITPPNLGATEKQTATTTPSDTKSRFKTVLGLSSISALDNSIVGVNSRAQTVKHAPSKGRRSVDITRKLSSRRNGHKSRKDRASVTDSSFFQARDSSEITDAVIIDERPVMQTEVLLQERANRRKLAHLEAQDGPWVVSVADTPYDEKSYTIYIKSES